jgi:hypothetical protein
MWCKRLIAVILVLGLLSAEHAAQAVQADIGNTYTVTNTNASGNGSLYWALGQANGTPGPDTINFNIPPSDPGYNSSAGVWTIRPTEAYPLPYLTDDSTTIDGYTQPGASPATDTTPAVLKIEIDGSNAGFVWNDGLVIQSSENVVKGLAVNRFPDTCIEIDGTSAMSNTVSGNYVGIGADGATEFSDSCFWGLMIDDASNNTIGGTTAAERNVISGSDAQGVYIIGSSATGNTFVGNYVGTDAGGVADLGNTYYGVVVGDGANLNAVGGDEAGERNVISGNGWAGVFLVGTGTVSNTVSGNYIGTTASGMSGLGNGWGVRISGARNNVVGGSTAGERNVISGNTSIGVRIDDEAGFGTSGNAVLGNYIGLGMDGESAVGNSIGVVIHEGAQDNVIGPGNVIAYSTVGDGVWVDGAATTQNVVTQNSIFSNFDRGISLDNGGNGSVAAPVISAAALGAPAPGTGFPTVDVTGTACADCTVEVFANSDSGGEGEVYAGSAVADGGGNFTVNVDILVYLHLTATATDAAKGTSEFSGVFTSAVRGGGNVFLPLMLRNYP